MASFSHARMWFSLFCLHLSSPFVHVIVVCVHCCRRQEFRQLVLGSFEFASDAVVPTPVTDQLPALLAALRHPFDGTCIQSVVDAAAGSVGPDAVSQRKKSSLAWRPVAVRCPPPSQKTLLLPLCLGPVLLNAHRSCTDLFGFLPMSAPPPNTHKTGTPSSPLFSSGTAWCLDVHRSCYHNTFGFLPMSVLVQKDIIIFQDSHGNFNNDCCKHVVRLHCHHVVLSTAPPFRAHVHAQTHAHTRTHAHMHTYTHALMHTCTHAHMHACTHTHMRTLTPCILLHPSQLHELPLPHASQPAFPTGYGSLLSLDAASSFSRQRQRG